MIKFILQIVVFSSLGLMIYMIARAIPRVPEEVAMPRRSNWVDRLTSKIPMSAIDNRLNSFFAKLLRKFRVVIMKIDNFINDRLGKLNRKVPPPENKDSSPPRRADGEAGQDQNKTVL